MRNALAEAVLALVWLTRLPLGRFLPAHPPPLARAAWAFPLVGLVIGAGAGLVYGVALWLGLTPVLAALLAVGVQIWLTGGLHEDGLADLADGLGGRDPARRLEIMRDSRIGSYGALTLGLVTALRVAALASLAPVAAVAALLVIPALSRAGMVTAMALMKPARTDGLGKSAGQPNAMGVVLAQTSALALCAVASLSGAWPGLWPFLAVIFGCAFAQLYVKRMAYQKLGGATGDVFGAIQQSGEVGALLALVAAMAEKL
ncbi:adenosylcobinamide-GDP ribazoletransferase [Paracoccus aminophilus]|uniref:Adenosylcobinamide-GDP ribazoletransferase n=1 Tax=Paracoccus aminophilus JCM 7686 TaxID=1367847 RepID=S5XTZ9_PARAH|nr:adenosylcobinamide-GDP ribazoletransferase [Paracoccus aminophilus]AGT08652.1 cobalamin synthase [Paracoccus aminophilus JCM 7686]